MATILGKTDLSNRIEHLVQCPCLGYNVENKRWDCMCVCLCVCIYFIRDYLQWISSVRITYWDHPLSPD